MPEFFNGGKITWELSFEVFTGFIPGETLGFKVIDWETAEIYRVLEFTCGFGILGG
jgi:hypothetical protein